jgi:two-component system, OmpR family, sensor histidine kinase MtrB
MSLHRTLTVFMAVLAVIALIGAISLVILPTYVHRAALDLQNGLHSVRLAEEIQVDLLHYVRANDSSLRQPLEDNLKLKLAQASMLARTSEESAAWKKAADSIQTQFEITRTDAADRENWERAFDALQQLVILNVGQADKSVGEAARWDRMGDWIGIGSATLLVASVTGILIWLGLYAFRPVFEIRDAMKSFGEGTRTARAPEHGPGELRSIAAQFNHMADTLTRQHENQLQFLSAVAHDLRNPLVPLKLSAQVLSSDRISVPAKISDLMSIIERQVHRLDRMIGDLLDHSRIEGGQLELRIVEYDARSIAEEAFNLFSSASTKHKLLLHVPDSQVPLRCDPFRIEQVLNNLISNAIKYSPAGGNIKLHVEQGRDEVQFHVSDQGMGIPEDELPYIFEPFRRVQAVKNDIPGVGLGLSVVRRIVQAHSGHIEVESRVGQGTTFRVHLPRPQFA